MTTKMLVTGVAIAAVVGIPGQGPQRTLLPSRAPGTSGVPWTSGAPGTSERTPAWAPAPWPATVPAPTTVQTPGMVPACRPDQIGPLPEIRRGAAGGNVVLAVTITGRKPPTCRLDDYPVLWHTEPGRAPVVVSTTRGGNDGHVVLAPGEQSTASFSWSNPYGYPPSAPECAHPAHYHGLALGVGGTRFSLPAVDMDVPCGAVSAQWL